ncbi:MAG: CRTAC1 family protein, partial [Gammaproteobacteria bacterium]|nr:CRTAC1 family protein [Gammaproteobacteria bacterium]
GSGAALLDFDADGDLDIYLVQSGKLGASSTHTDRLFRNQLHPRGTLAFVDVTDEAGLNSDGYGMGAAAADFDNDGDVDLYVTNFGPNRLLRNDGGTFTDITNQSGTGDDGWGTSAAFVDYDHDGLLDLFVANYSNYALERNKQCVTTNGTPEYCGPQVYPPAADVLYRNRGDGTFEDVSKSAGIRDAVGPGLGVICADFDSDGDTDIYVANDQTANQLWLNQGDGTFAEGGLMSGSAFNSFGQPEASMGVTAGDFDADGDPDLFMTHLNGQTNTLYQNDGKGNFIDATARLGLANLSLPFTGFGSAWFDVDNDGRLDLYIANGAVEATYGRGKANPYAQRNQLFVQQADGKFGVPADEPSLDLVAVSRGAAFGDLDNDGDIDILVTNNDAPVHLLLNNTVGDNHWLNLQLIGTRANRNGLGARVVIKRAGLPDLWRRAHTDGSFLNSNDPRVHFGLADATHIDSIVVYWPGGDAEQWRNVEVDQFVALTEGAGEPLLRSAE